MQLTLRDGLILTHVTVAYRGRELKCWMKAPSWEKSLTLCFAGR